MIDEKLSLVPHHPGCYLMKDKDGVIIYVGKSKNLKNRLSSYFKSSHTGKTAMLVRDIRDFEYILTSSELESLLLEINLIKKHDPKYNILLRDDKTYPYIEVTNEKYFRLLVVRNPNIRKRIHECILNANKKFSSKVTDLQKNLTLKLEDKIISIEFDNILFFETSQTIHKIILHAKDRNIEFYSKMKDIEEKLDNRFYRCHRSYLINKDNIKEIKENERIVYMTNDEECLISTRLLKGLLRELESTAS